MEAYGESFPFEDDEDSDVPYELRFQSRDGFKSQCTVVHMEACKESFRVASKHYSVAFATDLLAPGVWFNFGLDTLYLDRGFNRNKESRYGLELLTRASSDLSKVENLAFFHTWDKLAGGISGHHGIYGQLVRDLKVFPSARDISLVSRRHNTRNRDDLVFLPLSLSDLDTTLSYYRQPNSPAKELEHEHAASAYACAINGYVDPRNAFLLGQLRYWLSSLYGRYDLPNIARKMVATRHLEQTYLAARQAQAQAHLKKRRHQKIPHYYLISRIE